ncbi:MAG: phosphoribosylamine--glycine ligase [Desulfovibrio sp.]|nr:phosphoribosylamine--glycine ligase [Desulfovibrio sp.]
MVRGLGADEIPGKDCVLIIGKGAREDCVAELILASKRRVSIVVISEFETPGFLAKAKKVYKGPTDDPVFVRKVAAEEKPLFAFVGPEEPLAAGVVDALEEMGIPCVGPKKKLAEIEWSKSFARELLTKHRIPGNPKYKIFRTPDGIQDFLKELGAFVVKPDGLTGGKGVRIFGEHLHSFAEAESYARQILTLKRPVVIEEKLDGEEFSLQSFCDGTNVVDMPVVQDHKRAFEGDTGPNTGGMGSYSCADFGMPFLAGEDIREAGRINRAVAHALREETGGAYKGILYGGFIATRDGVRLIEYNARFGDPEAMNVLPLLKTDFVAICEAVIKGNLDELDVAFDRKFTVCKYVVPQGYPTSPEKDSPIGNIPSPSENLKVYHAAVDKKQSGEIHLTGSRAIALVAMGDTMSEAERTAEDAARSVTGPVRHRSDIGTRQLIEKRINHMADIRSGVVEPGFRDAV